MTDTNGVREVDAWPTLMPSACQPLFWTARSRTRQIQPARAGTGAQHAPLTPQQLPVLWRVFSTWIFSAYSNLQGPTASMSIFARAYNGFPLMHVYCFFARCTCDSLPTSASRVRLGYVLRCLRKSLWLPFRVCTACQRKVPQRGRQNALPFCSDLGQQPDEPGNSLSVMQVHRGSFHHASNRGW